MNDPTATIEIARRVLKLTSFGNSATPKEAHHLAGAVIEMEETLRWVYDNCDCMCHTCVNCFRINPESQGPANRSADKGCNCGVSYDDEHLPRCYWHRDKIKERAALSQQPAPGGEETK